MRKASVLFVFWLTAASAWAQGPQYVDDPFGDADFSDAPLILDVAHPTRGRGELSLWFTSSVIDKYTNHMGGLLQFDYNFSDSLGAALAVGFLHGALTNIVTDDAGIIGNKVTKCIEDAAQCGNINPNVPDYNQITGVVEGLAVWSPLYGKINVVSEIDVNLQVYVVGGVGVNGLRRIEATTRTPSRPNDYTLTGGGFSKGGFFSNTKVHGTVGVGLQVFVVDWLALRGETRGLLFADKFDFGEGEETYLSMYWFFQGGLGFILF
ncbi:outer membrane beta-barrel domain-containing protein [Myxococcota bacterium]